MPSSIFILITILNWDYLLGKDGWRDEFCGSGMVRTEEAGPDEPGRGRRAEKLNVKELISVTFNSPLRKG